MTLDVGRLLSLSMLWFSERRVLCRFDGNGSVSMTDAWRFKGALISAEARPIDASFAELSSLELQLSSSDRSLVTSQ